MIFRSVFYLFRKMQNGSAETEEKVYAHLGIDRHIDAFRRMEYNFQKHITGGSSYFPMLWQGAGKMTIPPKRL